MIDPVAGLYRAILKGDAPVAKACFGMCCMEGKFPYIQWRLPFWVASINYKIFKLLAYEPDYYNGNAPALMATNYQIAETPQKLWKLFQEMTIMPNDREALVRSVLFSNNYAAQTAWVFIGFRYKAVRGYDLSLIAAARHLYIQNRLWEGEYNLDVNNVKAAHVLPWWTHDYKPLISGLSREVGWDVSRVVRFIGHESTGMNLRGEPWASYLSMVFGNNLEKAIEVWEYYISCHMKEVFHTS